jgi:hypothetical protein
MFKNSFIPVFIPNLHNYLLNKFNVDIYNIPIDDWHGLICDNYCKNIINNTYCIKKYKKDINDDNSLFCSKCCEKKGIKRKKVYKKKTKNTLNNEDSDSGVYTESDDKNNKFNYKNINVKHFSLNKFSNTINEPTEVKLLQNKNNCHDNLFKIKKRTLMKIKILIYFKKLYLNNKNKYKQDNYISLGYLNIDINNKNPYPLFSNKNYNKINLNNVYFHINNRLIKKKEKEVEDVLNFGEENKHKYIMFGTLKVDINENAKINDSNDKNKLKKEKFLNNKNHDDGLKYIKENDFIDINSDLYYVFTYIIYLIFKTSNIKFIKDELHNCLGDLGVQHYISQYIQLNNNDLIY